MNVAGVGQAGVGRVLSPTTLSKEVIREKEVKVREGSYVGDELALHRLSDGHVHPKCISVHGPLEVVLRCVPLFNID